MGLRACVHRWARARRHANVMRARTLLWAVRGWAGRAEAYREACVASVPRGERSLKQVHACCVHLERQRERAIHSPGAPRQRYTRVWCDWATARRLWANAEVTNLPKTSPACDLGA